jgi:hypothetical protein
MVRPGLVSDASGLCHTGKRVKTISEVRGHHEDDFRQRDHAA